MKKTVLLFVFFLSISILSAQNPLVITKQNFNISPVNDSIYSMQPLTGILVPDEGANLLWDYSALTKSEILVYMYKTTNDPNFTGAFCSMDSSFDEIALNRGFFYREQLYNTDSGYYGLGISIDTQLYPIGSLTGNVNDSMNIIAQYWKYESPRWIVKFPYTYGTKTVSNYEKATDFYLSLSAMGIINAPSKKIAYITQTDSVIGWGRLILPALTGSTPPIEVLMTKRYVTEIDSFFINDAPAPFQLLFAFGLYQGQIIDYYSYNFMRENHKNYLLSIGFQDQSFSQISYVYWDKTADLLTGIEENPISDLQPEILISPNPVNDFLRIKDNNIKRIQIISHEGKKVIDTDYKEIIDVRMLPVGVYYCNLSFNNYNNNNKTIKFVLIR